MNIIRDVVENSLYFSFVLQIVEPLYLSNYDLTLFIQKTSFNLQKKSKADGL